jgi:hypothetical protein
VPGCNSPLDVWPAAPPLAGIVFSPRQSYAGARAFSVPCGRCVTCRLGKAQEWGTRIYHETLMHADSCFLTLTYDAEHLPADHSVSVKEFQDFMKRFRKAIDCKIRFVACGEYGGLNGRPHYHAIIFGYGFPDRLPWRKTKTGHLCYRSAQLDRLWGKGNAEIGSVTSASGAYVARYTLKKMYGDSEEAVTKYLREEIDAQTGEVRRWCVAREFFLMSRRPGIGGGWFEQFGGDAFPSDFVTVGGQKRLVPRYYFQRLKEEAPEIAAAVIGKRRKAAEQRSEEHTSRRMLTKLESATIKTERIARDLEEG